MVYSNQSLSPQRHVTWMAEGGWRRLHRAEAYSWNERSGPSTPDGRLSESNLPRGECDEKGVEESGRDGRVDV